MTLHSCDGTYRIFDFLPGRVSTFISMNMRKIDVQLTINFVRVCIKKFSGNLPLDAISINQPACHIGIKCGVCANYNIITSIKEITDLNFN